ncbi:AMP-binding protein [Streptomyces sp. PTM05]|uniref:AMP-binding protein n=1 Tax=Streptantibioticus parmotrematis TaxID=2873249 RepID=A0ABS7R4J6_9ACTN|nr:AMP-binding protein [Streptantibioticus parmotrematis]
MRRWWGLWPGSLPTLRVTLFAGEAPHVADARGWYAAVPNAVLDNHCGPTELNITCTVHRWDTESSPRCSVNGIVPIGTLYEGLDHVLLDSAGNINREPGELCVSGPQTMSGYLDPRDDEGRFVDYNRVRWCRTGDIVRGAAECRVGVPGAQRRSGADPRQPCAAQRDRPRAEPVPRRDQGRDDRRRRESGYLLLWSAAHHGGVAREALQDPAEKSGPEDHRPRDVFRADPEREDRPQASWRGRPAVRSTESGGHE